MPPAVISLGCKVSRAEAASLAALLPEGTVLVHACTVTARADRDALRLIRRARRENPGSTVVVAGCLAQRVPEALAALPEVDLVLGLGRRGEAGPLLAAARAGLLPSKVAWDPPGSAPPFGLVGGPFAAALDPDRTRAFLKVQDGCSRRCAFCVVPSLRGRETSAPLSAVADEIARLGDEGVAEVVLTGVHLASFGTDRGESLLALVSLLERRPPACRVRLSSLEPMEAGADLVEAVASSSVLAPHLHLPLQSGSDAVLRKMRRGTTAGRFARLVERAVRANGGIHVATDLIAGYPGETDADFGETVDLARALPLASLHVFPFSPRSGTAAAAAHDLDPVPAGVARGRAARLRLLGEAKAAAFARAALSRPADVVALRGGVGLTADYLEVDLAAGARGEAPRPGERFPARLHEGPRGRLVASPSSC